MAAPEVHHLFHNPIADHSFSADRSTLAIARDTTVELYGRAGNAFKLKDELKGHDKLVTSVDIAPNSGRIVTSSQDRNALVWEPSPEGYKPTLVLLRINRAATFVRWSPSETKFAVGSGDRVIAISYFEEENDWWVSKHLKKPIRSTITSVAWHPNSVLLAAGSTDAHARVFSSFIKSVDARPEPSAWGERLPFNTVCGEFLNNSAGWVHSVAFSPSGDALAFASHDSSITVVYPSAPEQPPKAVISVTTQLLPFMSLFWSNETEIIAAGYDCEAFRFQGGETGWQLAGTLESKARPGLSDAREDSALNMFRQMDLKGKVKDDTKLSTVHQNTITTIRPYESSGASVSKFSLKIMANLNMAERSPSPSARFYAHSSTPKTPQMHQQLLSTHETESPRAHHNEPFEQFQGFSAPSTRNERVHPRFGVYGYNIPEEDISPRMAVPNPVPWETTRSQVQAFVEDDGENDDAQPRIYQVSRNIDPENNIRVTPEQCEAAAQQWLPSHNFGPDDSPMQKHICVNFEEPLQHIWGGFHGGTPPHMPSSASRHPNTFRVPSDSEPGHLGIRLNSPPFGAFPDDLEVEKGASSIPSSILGEGEGAGTIYPEDSVSATSRAGAPPNAVPLISLVDYVVEIHDICLAATQRHLNSLRVNWDLRLGRPVSGVEEHLLGGRPSRGHDRGQGDRWAPYVDVGSCRRALSESHIEHMTMGNKGEHYQHGGHHHLEFAQRNPIPKSTNSLLHNIRLVCDLIWRRAQRDREDVLGAELKGCREMNFLYECGEMIVLYNTLETEKNPQACWHRIVTAGTGICQTLGDSEGMRLMGLR
ncbi:ARP2/3 actin-organizing complex subunit Sop2 [Gnomoniopsis sp. IMI 355080]|nr:ARP2/3 actin-organizing complex subunit Sop2 [Gnomoniopsis sp. IMI 355080]